MKLSKFFCLFWIYDICRKEKSSSLLSEEDKRLIFSFLMSDEADREWFETPYVNRFGTFKSKVDALFSYSGAIAKRFYHAYENYYKKLRFDEEEMRAEGRLVVVRVLSSYKDKECSIDEYKRLISAAAKNHFLKLLEKSKNRTVKTEFLEEKKSEGSSFEETLGRLDLMHSFRILVDDIKTILSPEEFDIFYKKYIKSVKSQEIAESLNKHKSTVNRKLKRCREKLIKGLPPITELI